jgi:hypothetical protein
MVLAPTLGATGLDKPWSFLAGFVVGIVCGLGITLVIYGLVARRRQS